MIGIMSVITMILVYTAGSLHGAAAVQKQWDIDTAVRDSITHAYKVENENLLQRNKELIAKHTKELSIVKQDYDSRVKRIESEYSDRMRKHEDRARLYQQQAQGGATECRNLGDYATGLDKQLEQGIYVVDELQELVKLRDSQLIILGNQIRADRKVLKRDE